MPLRIGETFAGYRVLRLLGSGGMGEVYLVQHPRLPRQDALKVLRADVSSDPSFRERFIREADLAADLRHPHIVGIHDRGEQGGHLWIAMDYIDGADLAHLLGQRYPGGMPIGHVLLIVAAVSSALDYAHKRGLLHRDVKPANIIAADLDTDDPTVFLADFGIARPLDDTGGITTTNMTVGTVAYAAPEQLMGEPMDGRADQYALAATTYNLLSGSQLFPNSNPAVVISRHLNAKPPAVGDTYPELALLDTVLAVGLAKGPNDRFHRCADFARALKQAAAPAAASAATPTAQAPTVGKQEPPRPANRAKRWWLVAAAVATSTFTVAALMWHPWHQALPPTTSTNSPPATAANSAGVAPPPPAPPPTAASAEATKVITVVAVSDGRPANGYREVSSTGDFTNVSDCDISPAAVSSGIYLCAPWAARAVVCWPSTSATVLCGDDPWAKELHRFSYEEPLPVAKPKATPMPFALRLDDGNQCRIRVGGAWGVRDDGLTGVYGCDGESAVLALPQASWELDAFDRSGPLWTVKVGPLSTGNLPPPQTHSVTTAWFAGN
ncbi:serine/threonine-protein kinase [Mycolicibacterium sp. BK634]|uniref:serine/threonine-protein kinase n=1 Tax=Mycolicibacterium sp. BK634 TaxID=2587099 RepID=UPI00160F71F5|nr:serine/threonine-protein kinase [Mycolicibacterium sp. BK634]MBB3749863.1 serine/threonine-protein kinase [Mycolicibacterium sp. BK634]